MVYLIRDARDETDPNYLGWLASPVPTAFIWTRKIEMAKRFTDLTEAARICKALQKQRRPTLVIDIPG